MKKALGTLTALLLLIVMLPAAAEAVYYEYMEYDRNTGEDFYDPDTGRITGKWRVGGYYYDENWAWHEIEGPAQYVDAPPSGAELWIINPPVPLTVEGNFSDVCLIGGTVTFLGDIEWLTLLDGFEADWKSPDITVYGDIEKITMSPLRLGEMSLRTTGDIGVVYLKYGEEGPFKSFSWYGDGVTMATLMDKGSILPPLSDGAGQCAAVAAAVARFNDVQIAAL